VSEREVVDAGRTRTEVYWGNVTPDGDCVPRPTETDARQTAESKGWPVVRRTVTFSPWERA
jgi:hypothetical protein